MGTINSLIRSALYWQVPSLSTKNHCTLCSKRDVIVVGGLRMRRLRLQRCFMLLIEWQPDKQLQEEAVQPTDKSLADCVARLAFPLCFFLMSSRSPSMLLATREDLKAKPSGSPSREDRLL